MPYVDPETVKAPRRLVSIVDVLHNTGKDGWSVARVHYGGEPRLGIRWNGGKKSGLGTPQSRGTPTWFLLPREFEQTVLERVEKEREGRLLDGYREMASDTEREAEALEWSEGLISDAVGQER